MPLTLLSGRASSTGGETRDPFRQLRWNSGVRLQPIVGAGKNGGVVGIDEFQHLGFGAVFFHQGVHVPLHAVAETLTDYGNIECVVGAGI